jgi:putative redox protein
MECCDADKSVAKIKWVGKRQFVGTSREHSVVLDQKTHEKGENTGFKPTELLLISIGGCLGTTLISMAELHEKRIDSLYIDVEIERNSAGDGWLFRIKVKLEGDMDEKERAEFIKRAEEICKISNIVRNENEIILEL